MIAKHQQINMIPFSPLPQNSVNSAQTNIVSIAANECHPAETAVKSTVQMHVETQHTKNENERNDKPKINQGDDNSYVTSPPTPKRPYRYPVVETAVCEHCGAEMDVKRANGPKRKRYCSSRCRVAAHRARQGGQS